MANPSRPKQDVAQYAETLRAKARLLPSCAEKYELVRAVADCERRADELARETAG